jgi:hypothetical protein
MKSPCKVLISTTLYTSHNQDKRKCITEPTQNLYKNARDYITLLFHIHTHTNKDVDDTITDKSINVRNNATPQNRGE